MRRLPRPLLPAAAALTALALLLAIQPIASASAHRSRWRWWWNTSGQATQPAPAPSSVPSSAPSPGGHDGHGAGAGGAQQQQVGVGYDASKIPAGDPGAAGPRVQRTGELPGVDPDGIGAFRTVCSYSHMRADDPIVKPGQAGGSHLHTFWGNTTTDANSTAESLRAAGNGTCRGGTANRTGYWVPSVIDTRSGNPQAPVEIHVYYKSGYAGIRPDRIEPMPAGLRMVAGDATASAAQPHQGWSCWNNGGIRSATIPRCPGDDRIAMDVEFPQCWNGDLDAPDHRSHLAYPRDGDCPATHPRAIPVVSYHVLYKVPAGGDVSAWRLASDMYAASAPGGYSVHGDWLGAWDPEILDTWTRLCVRRPATTCGSHLLGDGRIIT